MATKGIKKLAFTLALVQLLSHGPIAKSEELSKDGASEQRVVNIIKKNEQKKLVFTVYLMQLALEPMILF